MPTPTGFPQVNRVMQKPQEWEEGTCSSLPTFTDGHRFISKWSFSEIELQELQKSGHLWVDVACGFQPPIRLSVLPILRPDTSPKKVADFNGTCCPRCKSTAGIQRKTFMWMTERLDWKGKPTRAHDVGPSTSVSECVDCGFRSIKSCNLESREIKVCKAIYSVTGVKRELNESMASFQKRLVEKFGEEEWPAMLQKIVNAVLNG